MNSNQMKVTIVATLIILLCVTAYFYKSDKSINQKSDSTEGESAQTPTDSTTQSADTATGMISGTDSKSQVTSQEGATSSEDGATSKQSSQPGETLAQSKSIFRKIMDLFTGPVKPGTPGKTGQTPGTIGADGVAGSKTQPEVPARPANECYSIKYKHKELRSHANGEACTDHQNLIVLEDTHVNKNSVCVRVNGTPVKHRVNDKNTSEVMIGSVAGPHAEITVSYCTGHWLCSAKCEIPKDEFLDAIGGNSNDLEEELPVVQWDSTSKKKGLSNTEKNLDEELKGLNSVMAEAEAKSNVFKGWLQKEEQTYCEQNRYKKEAKDIANRN